jgi:hypothetical protein
MSQQINLYNPLFLRKQKYFSARTMLQSLGLIAAGLLALYAYALFQTRGFERLAKDYAGQLSAQRAQFVALGGQGRGKFLEAEVARLEGELRGRRATLDIVKGGEHGNTEGFSRYFAAFGRHPMRGVWLTGFSVGDGGNDLRVRGRVLHADLVPAYLKALNDEEVMRGRLVTELKMVAKDESAARRGSGAAALGPERFVEFDLAAPIRAAELGRLAGKAGKP